MTEKFLQRLAGKLTEASTLLQWYGFVAGFLLLCCVVQSFAFAEVSPTGSIPSTQNESWLLWRAEWKFSNLLACRTFFSWFPFPSFSFPHTDMYFWTHTHTFSSICTHPYTGAHASSTYVCTHVPMPRGHLSKHTAAFLFISSYYCICYVQSM